MSDKTTYPNAARPFANLPVDAIVRILDRDHRVVRVIAPGNDARPWGYILTGGPAHQAEESQITGLVGMWPATTPSHEDMHPVPKGPDPGRIEPLPDPPKTPPKPSWA